MNRRRTPCLVLAVLAVTLAASSAVAASSNTRQCSDPCIQAARSAYLACASSATGAFTEALDGCLERDRTCIDACRADRQDCVGATSLGEDLAACQLELAAARDDCRTTFPLGSNRRKACLDRAQIGGFRCRRRAGARVRLELEACGASFVQCAEPCGPGEPPGGIGACRAEGRAAVEEALGLCKTTRKVTVSACLNKDLTCLQDCGDAQETCTAPTRASLDGALATCQAERDAAVAACQAENPGGGASLEDCIETAQADALACRDTALDASQAGFASCTTSYAGCVRGCPAP